MRLANDRFEQFQAGLKRVKFDMDYTVAVERRTGLLRSLRAEIISNSGGRKNKSVLVGIAGATSLHSVYYFPKTDVAVTAIASRAVGCGATRGFGALETMTATELMMDEIAAELGFDPIDFRLRNVLKTGMRNAQGTIPLGIQRAETVLEKARTHPLWSGRAARKQVYDAAHPGKYYGIGFGCIQRRCGDGAEASFAKIELAPDGRTTLFHSGTEIGTGMSSGQAVACARWLGRPADTLDLGVIDWRDLPVETSGDPFAMSQAIQDHLAKNPRWTPAYASTSSASNSSHYFSHGTLEASRIIFLRGLWPAALAIWARDASAGLRVPTPEDARWHEGALSAGGREPLPLARLAQEAHARGLVVGAAVHAFNCWQWAEGDFIVDGAPLHAAIDALAVRYGNGTSAAKQALATTPNHYQVLNRLAVSFPPTQYNNRMVGYNIAVGTLAELAVDASSGKVTLLTHHTILDAAACSCHNWYRARFRGRPLRALGWRCTSSFRFTRRGRATAPGISTVITCRGVATWRFGSKLPKSYPRYRRASPQRVWPTSPKSPS